MTATAKTALCLWIVLALAVFSVTFDWQTRIAGFQFVSAQVERRTQGLPLETIESGFRPLVRAAALRSSLWPLAILIGGGGAVLLAARRQTKDAY